MRKLQPRRQRKRDARRGRSQVNALTAIVILSLFGMAVYALTGRSTEPPAPALPDTLDSMSAYLDPLCADPPPSHSPQAVTRALCQMERALITLTDGKGRSVNLAVLVPQRAQHQWAGYQQVGPEVIAQTAMLFVLPYDARGDAYHMCNVRAELDLAWFRADGTLLDIVTAKPGPTMPPAACPAYYGPRRPGSYRFVLETAGGRLEEEWELDRSSLRLSLSPNL